jgi:type I restriction enzyme S subunit
MIAEIINNLAPWAAMVPSAWKVHRIGVVADIIFSNVDKHTIEGEYPIRLCNYTDVYKNDRITASIEFMEATALQREIEKFQVRIGDVLATKDSESPNDIAVSSLIEEALPSVLCGYHLAMIRPDTRKIYGPFLAWVQASKGIRVQYEARATGVTRFGLSQTAFKETLVPIPPVHLQRRIAAYLDEQTAKIDRLMEMRRRQIELLKEQRAALIQQAVTRGLNPDVPMKDSGIPWLREIPAHWKKTKLLRIAHRGRGMFVNGPFGSDLLTSELTDFGIPVIYIRDIKAAGYLRVSEVCVTAEKAASLDVFRVDAGDIVVAKVGNPPGTAAVYPETEPSGIVTQDVIRIKTDPRRVNAEFIVYWLNSDAGQASIDQISVESTRMRVDLESYKSLRIWLPPIDEQSEIIDFVKNETTKAGNLIAFYTRQLTLLAEYRASLIHEYVTGQRLVPDTFSPKD